MQKIKLARAVSAIAGIYSNKSKTKKPLCAKLIANPESGDAETGPQRLDLAVRYLTKHGMKVDVAYAAPKEAAAGIARKATKAGYDIIIAMGGDGTLGEVVRGMVGSRLTLGIIVGGTMNDIAASLGIPEDVQAACELIISGQTRRLDLGRITTRQHRKFHFIMVAVIGLTATMFPLVKQIPKGKLTSIWQAITTFFNYKTQVEMSLTLDDESKITVKSMMVTVANTPLIASKNLVAPDASMEDGLFDISVFPNFSKAEILSYFARTANEGLIPDGKLQRFRAQKIVVKSNPKLEVAADGVSLGTGKAVIKICPQALRVFAPAAKLSMTKKA